MIEATRHLLRSLWPTWLGCLLLPLPALLFWDDGFALLSFFLSCSIFVVAAFRGDIQDRPAQIGSPFQGAHPVAEWRRRLLSIAGALLLEWVVFSSLCLAFGGRDFVAVVLALLTIIATLCIAPYLTLVTRQPFAAVVLTLFAVACMKMVAGAVTVLVYGWHASEFGHTDLTWTHPNVIVWTLVLATANLATAFYVLGRRRFCAAR